MEIPRFRYFGERTEALSYFDYYGLVVFRDLAIEEHLENMKSALGMIISQQVEKHLDHPGDYPSHGFDRGLRELAEKDDHLRERLYHVIQDLAEIRTHALTPAFYELIGLKGIKRPILRTSQFRMDLPGDTRFLIPPHQEIRGIRSPNLTFFITALEDISEKNGALLVAPGSCKLGPLVPEVRDDLSYQFIPPEKYQKDFPVTQVALKAGETCMLNMYTIHGSSENNSDLIRWSAIVRFEDAAAMPYLDCDDSRDIFNRKG